MGEQLGIGRGIGAHRATHERDATDSEDLGIDHSPAILTPSHRDAAGFSPWSVIRPPSADFSRRGPGRRGGHAGEVGARPVGDAPPAKAGGIKAHQHNN